MKTLIMIITLIPGTAAADKIYKCTDQFGNVSFQAQPCKAEQTAERITLPTAPQTNWQPTEIEEPDPYQQQLEQIRRTEQESQAQYEQRIREINQRHCQYYKDRLADVQQRWQTIKRQGYQQSQKDYWEDRIASRQRDVNRECN